MKAEAVPHVRTKPTVYERADTSSDKASLLSVAVFLKNDGNNWNMFSYIQLLLFQSKWPALITLCTGGSNVQLACVFPRPPHRPHSEANIQRRKRINVFVYLIDLDGCHMNSARGRNSEPRIVESARQ